MVLGNTKWVLSFMQYAIDELFDVADGLEPVLPDPDAFAQKGKEHHGIPQIGFARAGVPSERD
jgi:hypothetical protein